MNILKPNTYVVIKTTGSKNFEVWNMTTNMKIYEHKNLIDVVSFIKTLTNTNIDVFN